MKYEVYMNSDKKFENFTFNGEDFICEYDIDSTLEKAFIDAFSKIGLDFTKLSHKEQIKILEDTFYDIEHSGIFFNITINQY